jgi:hypothetical protein
MASSLYMDLIPHAEDEGIGVGVEFRGGHTTSFKSSNRYTVGDLQSMLKFNRDVLWLGMLREICEGNIAEYIYKTIKSAIYL